MTTILLLCVVTWIVFTAFVYLIEDKLVLSNLAGILAAGWVGLILMFIGMVGR